eukprot:scaffold1195_cov200-Alexandrium_tamarense.AAC.1
MDADCAACDGCDGWLRCLCCTLYCSVERTVASSSRGDGQTGGASRAGGPRHCSFFCFQRANQLVCQQLILFKRNSNQAATHDLPPFQFQTNNNLKPTLSMMSFFPNDDNKENISNNDDKENIAPIPRKTVASSATISPVKNRLKQTASDIKLILQATAVPVQQRCEDDALLYWSDEFDKLGEDESVVEAFQCIQQSETIHPLLRGF